jgi:hypothetical protein
VVVAAGRSAFRVTDLLTLADLIEVLQPRRRGPRMRRVCKDNFAHILGAICRHRKDAMPSRLANLCSSWYIKENRKGLTAN